MIELVRKKCESINYKKVGILGTPVLIHSVLYQKEFEKFQIDLVVPTENQIEIADSIIRDVLAGKKDFSQKQNYIDTLSDLFDKGAQGIILGCTELPLAINYEALGNKMISSDEVLAEGIVDYYYQ
jgi:aspartate racemase